jgi:uncharacterized protein YjeT (DUF2065 family)
MNEFIVALGLLFVIEGVLYFAFPEQMKKMMMVMKDLPAQKLRSGGLFFAIIGFILIWVIKH